MAVLKLSVNLTLPSFLVVINDVFSSCADSKEAPDGSSGTWLLEPGFFGAP
jgi:hypothetical protein